MFYAIVIWVCLAGFPLVSLLGEDTINASSYLLAVTDVVAMFIPFFVGAFISVCIAFSFINKTGYYEIMSGKSTNSIFLGRIIIYTVYMTCGLIASMGIVMAIFAIAGGKGDMDKMAIRILLFALIIVHICVAAVLLSLIGHSLVSPILIFLRFEIVEGILTMLIPQILSEGLDCSESTIRNFSNCFIVSQIGSVFTGNINTSLVLCIVISFLVESLLWYLIAAGVFRKKLC
jgi:hypothetical protein